MSILRVVAAAAAAVAVTAVFTAPVRGQQGRGARTGLFTEALAGQMVAVLPLTHLVRDTALHDPELPAGLTDATRWTDTLIGDALLERAPEVNWILPPDLRRMARRAAGMVPEPDRLGHSVLRGPKITTVPDPLRSNLRTLMAIGGGRHVFVPASLVLGRDEEGAVRATLAAVLTDARLGQVLWRVEAIGSGPTSGAAIRAAVESFLPFREP